MAASALLEKVLRAWQGRLPLTPAQLEALGQDAYSRGWGLADVWEKRFLERVQASITTAMGAGSTLSEWMPEAQRILDSFGGGVRVYRGGDRFEPAYAELVLRNATQASFAGGRYSAMWSPEWQQVAPFWRYYATRDDRTRPEHAALHGMVFRKADAAARAYLPPWGHNCRCQAQELTLAEVEDAGFQISDGARVPFLETEGGGLVGRPPGTWDVDRTLATTSRPLLQAPRPSRPQGLPAAPPAPAPAPLPAPALAPVPAPAPPRSRPLGTKVSSRAAVKARGKRRLEDVFDIIDSIHGDGNLGHAGVFSVTPDRGYYRPEQTRWSRRKRQFETIPRALNVGREAKHWRVQLAHEIGHWIDHEGLAPFEWDARGHMVSHARKIAPEVMTAIDSSKAVKNLERVMARGRRRSYILSDEEKWARAYSQFIAIRSGDAEMLKGVALWRSGAIGREPDGLWDSDDFKPVLEAFETVFRRLGWLT